MFKTLQWEDWAGIALGAWLIVSPWILGYAEHSAATVNSVLLGTVLAVAELLNLDEHKPAEEWIDLVAGLWLALSPALLGFVALTQAAVNAVAVGLLSMLLAAFALSPLDQRARVWWREHRMRH